MRRLPAVGRIKVGDPNDHHLILVQLLDGITGLPTPQVLERPQHISTQARSGLCIPVCYAFWPHEARRSEARARSK